MVEFIDGRLKNGKDLGTYVDSPITPNISEMLYRLSYPKTNASYSNENIQMFPSKGDMEKR